MESNLKSVTVTGRVGQDATQDAPNQPVRFSVAVNQWNADTQQEEVTWVDCSAWDKRADLALARIKKGMRVWVTGKHSLYQGANGVKDQLKVSAFGPASLFPAVDSDEDAEW